MKDMPVRICSGLVLILLALGTFLIGIKSSTSMAYIPFVLFWYAAAILVFAEWARMISPLFLQARILHGTVCVSLILFSLYSFSEQMALVAGIVGLLSGVSLWRRPILLLWGALGFVYASALLVSVIMLFFMTLWDGYTLPWIFALVWGTDIAAYFGGRLIGGPKLCPAISPGKTWSGFIIGTSLGTALGVLVLWWLNPSFAWPIAMGWTLLLSLISQVGDLVESAMKRHFAVKDSGHLIPGHGGLMDRLDGFIFAASAWAILTLV